MIRKLLVLSFCYTLLLVGCAPRQSSNSKGETDATPVDVAVTQTSDGTKDFAKAKILVVYFSRTGEQYNVGVIRTGNTAIVAKMIANYLKADLYEVKTEKNTHYSTSYDPLTTQAKKEQQGNQRPAFLKPAPKLNDYDVVFFGAPVWWGDWPMIMYTIFESTDLQGKTLVPFCTHEGSGMSGLDVKLKKQYPKCDVLTGLALTGSEAQKKRDQTQEKVVNWLEDIGFTQAEANAQSNEPEPVKADEEETESAENVDTLVEITETVANEELNMSKEAFDKVNVFGQGTLNEKYAQFFIGNSYLNPLTDAEVPIQLVNVTFEPGCRNNWHIHHAKKGGGQILICTAGEGWYQAEGEDPVELKPGKVVFIPAGVKHWHGAKKDSWFSHIALEAPGEETSNEWLEPVDDQQYNALP